MVIIKNDKGTYSIISGMTDEILLKDVDEHGIKSHLMKEKIWKLFDDIIKINMEFPNHFIINGKRYSNKINTNYDKWFLDNCDKDNFNELIFTKMIKITKNHDLSEFFEPLVTDVNVNGEETITITKSELMTFRKDISNFQNSWSDTSYRLVRFIDEDPKIEL